MEQIKNCKTCAHCEYKGSATYDHCILGGNYCSIMRQFPTSVCDANLSGWAPRTTSQTVMDNLLPLVCIIGSGILIIFTILK